jgi:immunity protein 74 of polymorphic toxin system
VFDTACFIGGIRVKPRAVPALFSLVYKDTVQKWDSPYDNVPVTDSDRDRILNNIREAFRSQGFVLDVT